MLDEKGLGDLLGLLGGRGTELINIAGKLPGSEGEEISNLGNEIKSLAEGGGGQRIGQKSESKVDAAEVGGNVADIVVKLTDVADAMTDDPEKEKVIKVIGELAKLADTFIEAKNK